MKTNIVGVSFASLFLFVTAGAFAADGNVTGFSVTPSNPKPSEPITVKVFGTVKPGKSCRIIFLKGDGTPQLVPGNASSFPFTFGGDPYDAWIYKNPGTYTIKVYPDPNQLNTKCTGGGEKTIKVSNPTPSTATMGFQAKTAVFSAACPPGWHLASGNPQGAYTCKPNKPAPVQCPPKHQWIETECAVGCQQIIY